MSYSYNLDLNKYNQPYNILLVPNQRLARKLIKVACERKLSFSSSCNSLVTPITGFNILSLNDFITNIFNSFLESGKFAQLDYKFGYQITKLQREIIFKDIIKDFIAKNAEYSNCFTPELIIKKVTQAWELVQNWQLNWTNWSHYLQPEANLFCLWASEYCKKLRDSNYIDTEERIAAIIDLLNKNAKSKQDIRHILKIDSIDLYGFDEVSPALKKLFDNLANFKINITNKDRPVKEVESLDELLGNKIKLFVADNIEQEINAAAIWANNYCQNNNNNLSNIGIIVPTLSVYRELFVKSFEETLPDRSLWNISGGEYLSAIPVIKSALILLELISYKKINFNELVYLLRSSYYFKSDIVDGSLDLLLLELKVAGYSELIVEEVVFYLNKINPQLSSMISDMIVAGPRGLTDRQTLPSQWVIIFLETLAALGWPAGIPNIISTDSEDKHCNTINSHDYQAIMQWQTCCQNMGQLDILYGSVGIVKAFTELKNIALNAPFQIETDNNIIDVLGMLEGAGLMYNELWLFNMSSEVWPDSPDPNPFIPVDLQRKYLLPHSTPQREFEYAHKLTKRYLSSSDNIIISYSQKPQETENSTTSLSSLLAKEIAVNNLYSSSLSILSAVSKTGDVHNNSDNKIIFKTIIDNAGPNLNSLDHRVHIKSGIRALNLQAACPFKAFAEIRLGSKAPYMLDIGPTSWLRGQVIHEILEKIYLNYDNKSKIINYINNADYSNNLSKLILEVLQKFKLKYRNTFKAGIVKIEQEIIFKIINNFLNFDINRQDFLVIAREQNCLFKMNNLQFNVRLDRVDKITGTDSLIIIDYKTTSQNINQLLGDELVDMQLPIYLFLDNFNNAQAIVFAEVMEHAAQYKGVGRTSELEGCIEIKEWDSLKAKWLNNINTYASSFVSGNAVFMPKPNVCRSCHLSGFCRKDEKCLV